MKSTRKPHSHLAGYIFERKHPKGHLVCYNAPLAGIDAERKYVVVLEMGDELDRNGSIGPSFSNLPDARAFVKHELAAPYPIGYDWGWVV